MNQPIKAELRTDIKKLLLEALGALPRSMESNIEAAKGIDAGFDAAAPNMLSAISRLRCIFSEIYSFSMCRLDDWQAADRLLAEAVQVNVSLLRLSNSLSREQGAPCNLSGGGDALFLYEDSAYTHPVMCAVRTITDVIYDLRCNINPVCEVCCDE